MGKISWKKGTGTFVYGCSIMMITFIMALTCIEQYARYDNAANTQIVADAVADGTAIYMVTNGGGFDEAKKRAKTIKDLFKDEIGYDVSKIKINKSKLENDHKVAVTVKNKFENITNVESYYNFTNGKDEYTISRKATTGFVTHTYAGSGRYRATINEQAKKDIEKASTERQILVNFALSKVGGTYVYGGTDFRTGVDCSAFTMLSYQHIGYSLPRTAAQQMGALKPVSRSDLAPGDLCFYTDRTGNIGHVTMYIGGDQVVHASNSTTGIIISDMSYRTPAGFGRVEACPVTDAPQHSSDTREDVD